MKCPPVRLYVGIMILMTGFTHYMLRSCISASLGEMVEPTKVNVNGTTCDPHKNATMSVPKVKAKKIFNWTEDQEGLILAAYFYGTMVTYLPGGTIAEYTGACNFIFWTTIASAILTALAPICTIYLDFAGAFTNRFIIGVLGGPVYSAMNMLIAKWAPPNEKGKFTTTLLGGTIGVVITWLMVGNVTHHWEWPAGFYAVAVFLTLFGLVFILSTTDDPDDHPWISEKEKNYIKEAQGGTVSKAKKIPPYRAIFTSIQFWATVIAQFGHLWVLNLLITFAPRYFEDVLKFGLKEAVVFASMPYLARFVFSQVFGVLGDFMKKKEIMSLTKIRKFFTIFSHFIPAVLATFLLAAGCNWQWAFTLLMLNQLSNSAVIVGHLANCQDLSPNFAGVLYGIIDFFGGITGFIVPSISSGIMDHMYDKVLAASIIFIIGSVVQALTGMVFIIFGTAEIQPWNDISKPHQPEGPQENTPR